MGEKDSGAMNFDHRDFLLPQSVLVKTSSKDMWSFKKTLIKVNSN